jgi:prevent-host-death family protein
MIPSFRMSFDIAKITRRSLDCRGALALIVIFTRHCGRAPPRDNLVRMTIRSTKTLSPPGRAKARRRAPLSRLPGHWLLQDAKARFSELVRRVRSEGPQHVTVHGRDEVVVVSAEEFRRLKGERSGDALIAAMQASPYRDIDIEPKRDRMPVRGIDL